ncbi:T9SS type A sorting domain-containing protein [Dysgonomonas sp. 520]|uniref:InlB B-repeat-containing protein n=1 Tax=Dysgonomonas sp. 520 TaxID=2302931 RepID=UPI0013D79A86|nr:T9SS type A sorting domain-containing protein [Dysgonomonas sp. 520]NDW08358.1 T9SS C-terminal target domain-containing protein [Dysgonomonas sp. 520]
MKKALLLFVLCLLAYTAQAAGSITFTWKANASSSKLLTLVATKGTNNITIDWGDGKSDRYSTATYDNYTIKTGHAYSLFPKNYTVIITVSNGTDLTMFDCSDNSLTALDVSKNTALKYLYCYNNQLTALDVSKNTALKSLYCYNNQLTALDVSKNTALIDLRCYNNQLSVLDVSKNTALIELYCYNNSLSSLDVSKNTALKTLDCSENQLSVLDVSKNTALIYLYCPNNQLSVLDVSKNTALKTLDCSENQLSVLDVSKNTALIYLYCPNNQLSVLDVSKNTALKTLDCSENQLSVLDVSKNTALIYLYCPNNQLSVLDVSNCTKLTELSCNNNQLSVLDVSKNTALGYLSCNNNQLSVLDVSKSTALTTLLCISNSLTVLDVSNCTKLTTLDCYNNQLSVLDVSKCTKLTELSCNNNQLSVLDVSKNTALGYLSCNNNQLSVLDVSKSTALTTLLCISNSLTVLDVSNCTKLTTLDCYNNQLSVLDVSKCTKLTELSCNNNQLSVLDVSKNTALKSLYCYGNQLSLQQLYAIKNNGASYKNLTLSYQRPCEIKYTRQGIPLTCDGTISDITVEGGAVAGTDYTYTNGTLTFLKTGTFSVKMTNSKVTASNGLVIIVTATYTVTPWDIVFTWGPIANNKTRQLRIRATAGTDNIFVDWGNGTNTTHDGQGGSNLDIPIPDNYKDGTYTVQIRRADKNHVISYLAVNASGVTELDVTRAPDLTRLYCNTNKLQALDLSNNKKIDYFECDNNQLSLVQLYDIITNGSPYANSCVISPQTLPEVSLLTGEEASIPAINGTPCEMDDSYFHGGSGSGSGLPYTKYTDGKISFSRVGGYTVVMTNTQVKGSDGNPARVGFVYSIAGAPCRITATPNNTAYGSVTGADTYAKETRVTLTATPKAGYQFVNWTEDGVQVSSKATYIFDVYKDRTLVANFEPSATVSIDNATADGIQVYPNPVVDVLHVKAADVQRVEVFNMQGMQVISQSGNVQRVDMSGLTPNSYVVIVRTSGKSYRTIVVKK